METEHLTKKLQNWNQNSCKPWVSLVQALNKLALAFKWVPAALMLGVTLRWTSSRVNTLYL